MMETDERIEAYATALLEVARAEGLLRGVADEAYRVARAFESSPDLRDALSDPRLPDERKQAILSDLLGDRALPLTRALVSMVVMAGRIADLPEVADRLAERAADEESLVVAEVRSAVELDEATLKRLAESLSRATGKRVQVKSVVDRSLIGGVVAKVGDTVIDGSLRHRFEELRQLLGRR
jgi:F-type H+-transporting ATPase subunit delta